MSDTPATEIGTSVVVLAEIRRGIEPKRRSDPKQAQALDRWFRRMREQLGTRVQPIAEEGARLSVPDRLPLVDGPLAATAKVRTLTLVTRNTSGVVRTGIAILDPFSDR